MIPIGDTIPGRFPAIALWALIALNVAVFLVELGAPPETLKRIFYWWGVVPALYTQAGAAAYVAHPWPFASGMFLHVGWAHLIMNLWTFWIFGDNVEDVMGPVRFTLFFLFCGVAAAGAHVWAHPDSTVPAVGASGAVAGIMGAYFVMYPRASVVMLFPLVFIPVFFRIPAVIYIGLWGASQALSGLAALGAPSDAGGVAFWAHLGGFAAGMLGYRFFVARAGERARLFRDEISLGGAWRRRK